MANKPFSWMGLLFGQLYYAGYGKVAKAIVLALIGFFPLTQIFVNIYCGIKARTELPVGEKEFNWGYAILLFIITAVIYIILFSIIQASKSQ